jgi:hypothetical protein
MPVNTAAEADLGAHAVGEGSAELSPVATDPHCHAAKAAGGRLPPPSRPEHLHGRAGAT